MAQRDIRVEAEWNDDIDLALLARALLKYVRLTQTPRVEAEGSEAEVDADASSEAA